VDLCRKRLHQQRGAAHRRNGLQNALPLRDECGDACRQRPGTVESASDPAHLLRLSIRRRGEQ
jgi:hypothetical protein